MRVARRACAPGKTLLMWPIAMSRESVPCGCQQPPKSTANLSMAMLRGRCSAWQRITFGRLSDREVFDFAPIDSPLEHAPRQRANTTPKKRGVLPPGRDDKLVTACSRSASFRPRVPHWTLVSCGGSSAGSALPGCPAGREALERRWQPRAPNERPSATRQSLDVDMGDRRYH